MYNKLILKNSGDSFKLFFNGEEHTVPSGLFEAEATLGDFVLYTAKKWWKNVTKESIPTPPKIEAIVSAEITPIEEVVEEVKEETKVEVKEDKKKK